MNNNNNNNALLIHLSAFSGLLIPFGSIILPIILWQSFKNESEYLNEQGKSSVNFNISFAIYFFVITVIMLVFIFASVFSLIVIEESNANLEGALTGEISGIIITISALSFLTLIKYILIIIAAIKANNNEVYKYPLTINFIK